jgi:galactonate dehydratase
MKITHVNSYIIQVPPPGMGGPRWMFVKLGTDDGIEGIGECAYHCDRLPRAAKLLLDEYAERVVIGHDPFRIEKLWWEIYGGHHLRHPAPVLMSVLSGIEMACWDIMGKALNQPVYNLLGGMVHEKLRAYSYLYGWAPGEAPQKAADRALNYVEQGFTAIKLDPIGGLPPDELKTHRHAAEVIRQIREAVGDSCDILIGTHGQLTTASAIRFAKRIEQYDPLWYEEPVAPDSIAEMARVARSTSIPIATGERLITRFDFAPLLEQQAAAILQMDLSICGGILETKKIASMAECHHAQIAPHLWGGPVCGAASIQVDTCSPNFLIQEGMERWDGFTADLLREPIRWENGYIIPPTKPGLGIELNEDVLKTHLVT